MASQIIVKDERVFNLLHNLGDASQKYVSKISIDWLRFSFLPQAWPFVRALFDVSGKLEDWTSGTRYRKKFFTMPMAGVTVAADEMPTQNGDYIAEGSRVIVDFSGNGLGVFFERSRGWADIQSLVSVCLAQSGTRVLRLDIAYDDVWGILDIKKMDKMLLDGSNVVTRWRTANLMGSYKIGVNSRARTLYIGSRSSGSFARVYDKRSQELARGAEEKSLPDKWVRFELEIKSDKATALAIRLVNENFSTKFIIGFLRAQIDFKEGREGTKQRRKIARWWKEFLGDVERQPVAVPKPVDSIQRKKDWMAKSVAPTMSLLMEHYEGDMAWVMDLLEDGSNRLTPQHKALLRSIAHGS